MRLRKPEDTRADRFKRHFQQSRQTNESFVANEVANGMFNLFYTRPFNIDPRKIFFCTCKDNGCAKRGIRTKHAVSKLCAASIEEQIRILDTYGFQTLIEDEADETISV